jgi:amino-acid N-acetyltransferase
MAGFTFSSAARSDAPAVRQLLSDCGLPSADIHEHLDHFIVAKDGHQLIGVIGLQLLGRIALLRSLAVANRYRNQGAGKALYTRLVAYAHLKGVAKLYLLTLSARPFFLHLGFEFVDRAAVPEEIRTTAEFRDLCPDTAVCLAKAIEYEGPLPERRVRP